jgi:hypothetical protein
MIEIWLACKEAERLATEARRLAEDAMLAQFKVDKDMEGTKTFMSVGHTVKITGRLNHKIDSDKLQAIAAEAGLAEHLGSLFRWKPEINSSAWKSADESITRPLLGAITTTAGRPSFSITKE